MVGDRPWVTGGRSLFLSGSVRNLLDWRRLCLTPLRPDLSGNTGGDGVVDIGTYSSADAVARRWPGSSSPARPVFAMQVRTLKTSTAAQRCGWRRAPTTSATTREPVATRPRRPAPRSGQVRSRSGPDPASTSAASTSPCRWRPPGLVGAAGRQRHDLSAASRSARSRPPRCRSDTADAAPEAAAGYYEHPDFLLPTTEASGRAPASSAPTGAPRQRRRSRTSTPRSARCSAARPAARTPGSPGPSRAPPPARCSGSRRRTGRTATRRGARRDAFGYAGGSLAGQIVIEVSMQAD